MSNDSLKEVLQYQHRDLCMRFARKFMLSEAEANEVFNDLKRWLYLIGKRGKDSTVAIYPCMAVVDEMWHEFICYSVDYSAFCDKYIGFFIHHLPRTEEERSTFDARAINDREALKVDTDKLLKATIEAALDELGEQVALRWFKEYRHKYSPNVLAQRQIHGIANKLKTFEDFKKRVEMNAIQ